MSVLEQLNKVPGPIRSWMGSEEVVDIIVDLEERYGLNQENGAITFLLFDLEVKDVAFPQLLTELAYDLGMTEQQAKPIYDEILSRILAPIATELVAYGVGTAQDFPAIASVPLPTPLAPAPAASARVAPAAPVVLPATPAVLPVTPSAPAAPITQQPKAPAAAVPAPVSLYTDTTASETTVATSHLNVGNTGDISRGFSVAPMPQRAAHVDLGIPASNAKDEEFKSLFVERATPKPQVAMDYGIPAQPLPPSLPDMAPTPVPLASAPVPAMDTSAPFITPKVEVVSIQSQPAPEAATEGGFFSSLIQRIAPWHAAKFGNKPLPTINYDETPPAAPAAPLSNTIHTPPPPQA